MKDKIEQARHLYFAQAKTQKEIARILDVCEKTVYNWIKRHSWDQMRQAARQAPAVISENLCSHIVELQNSIGRREPGCRYPTKEESQTILRLTVALEKMKKFPSLSMNMQVMTTFSNWASTRDKSFTRDLSLYSSLFLQGYAKNGYHPYEMEFGLEKISPIDPYYEEPTDDQPEPNEKISLSLPKDIVPVPIISGSLPNNAEPSQPQPDVIARSTAKPSCESCDEATPLIEANKKDILDSITSRTEDVILSLSKDTNSNANENRQNHLQSSENQQDITFPPPVKTGKNPASPDHLSHFPRRNWYTLDPTQQSPNPPNSNRGNNYPSRLE